MNYHRLLHLVISLGATLLENGAETYRVEESILRIFRDMIWHRWMSLLFQAC